MSEEIDLGARSVDADAPPSDDSPPPSGFAGLGLRSELLEALDALGYEEPTPIQRQTIPTLLTGADLLGQAATGTGKTAAFALPALQAIEPGAPMGGPSVLVLVPTRELAVQVSEAMVQYGKQLHARVVPVFGGQPIGRQLGALDRGAHVVVATPGRAIDHIGRGSLLLDSIRTVILDEADEMLDMGFTDDIESILESTPEDRQTVLFSATMPPRINAIAKRYQRDPVKIKIGKLEERESQKLIRQTVYFVRRADKPHALGRVLDIETPDAALVFCRTRLEVDQLTSTMNVRGYRAEALHGGMDQAQRDRVMGRLRDGTAELLVATDVAARGLDVDTLTHVVNYDVPSAAESYVHRIGRVGRAGREGTAITLADPRERRLLNNIERLTKQTIEVAKVPTVADLRARQVELTVAAVRESLSSPDLEDYNGVLHALAGEDSDRNIALAAIKLVHLARGAVLDEREIPDASDHRTERSKKFKDGKGKDAARDRAKGSGKRDAKHRKGERDRAGDPDTGFLYVSQGRKAGVRPGDLVGAIANESGLVGRDIGPIRISDHYSVVGVPKGEVDRVIAAMRGTTMRGKPVKVRPFNP
ncbi:MAG: DEAD/DEAH box helicase [Ilumatobacter sp.]|nr:DEAD/DEAH box helicase [Ilumatobacter sp.]